MKKRIIIGLVAITTIISACSKAETIPPSDKPAEASTVASTEAPAVSASVATVESTDTASIEEKSDLVEELLSETGADKDDVLFSQTGDFDVDGIEEAFVLLERTASESSDSADNAVAKLWYVTAQECTEIFNYLGFTDGVAEMVDTFDVGGKTYISVNEIFTTNVISHLYYVEDGACKESAISGLGYFFKPDDVDDYAISISDYDALYEYEEGKESEAMELGHTYKNYYFYYDESLGDFKEYVGTAASEEELANVCGFDLAEEIRSEGYQVDEIIKRENGIYTINYSKIEKDDSGLIDITRMNAMFYEKTHSFILPRADEENTWQNSNFDGKYVLSVSGE
ncbi:hypothetical protein [Butyrivibrio sp. MC2021]|uniref:hypothetical protein n=1 Tax=Butyrivibrio sp. MC2021 TaxID=1408306 RepID=UPI00047AD502|nr:hypothetical protein [Butyrivibrio sp. MC2021]